MPRANVSSPEGHLRSKRIHAIRILMTESAIVRQDALCCTISTIMRYGENGGTIATRGLRSDQVPDCGQPVPEFQVCLQVRMSSPHFDAVDGLPDSRHRPLVCSPMKEKLPTYLRFMALLEVGKALQNPKAICRVEAALHDRGKRRPIKLHMLDDSTALANCRRQADADYSRLASFQNHLDSRPSSLESKSKLLLRRLLRDVEELGGLRERGERSQEKLQVASAIPSR
mmetsp:Transcript_26684/g.67230  ORF Transcript_26684/g.67230 Transcript_26684/m.67230 type:complete len:228 (-) Transcript_26684:938-1621(-)